MRFKLLQLKEDSLENFWVYPILLTLLSIILLSSALTIDNSLAKYFLLDEYFIFKIHQEGMQQILSTVTTTSITITSVTFSITVLTLSLASNQLGPRLLPNFISQGKTQFVIGVFVGVYVYSLTLLVISSSGYYNNKPIFISLYAGILLAIFSFFVLIYFIHFVCNSIQVDKVLKMLANQISSSIKRHVDMGNQDTIDLAIKTNAKYKVAIEKTGYIETIELEAIKKLAIQNDCTIKLIKRPGDYVFKGMEVAKTNKKPDDNIIKLINKNISTGNHRNTIQDLEYGFEQITEIAVRALSPGVNNPFSAISCIHIISSLLKELADVKLPPNKMYDEDGDLRLVFKSFDYEGVVNISFNQIREHAKGYVSVNIEMLKSIYELLNIKCPLPMREALLSQARIITEVAKKSEYHKKDLDEILCISKQIQ